MYTKSANIFLSAIVHVAVAICAQIIMDAELQWQLFFFCSIFQKWCRYVGILKGKGRQSLANAFK